MIIDPNLVMFYVASPEYSAKFYTKLLDKEPVESSETFAMFVIKSGLRLGLWSKETVEPQPGAQGGGGELDFEVETDAMVDEVFAQWVEQDINILQPPTLMDFGYTFVALDPDNHRLRVYAIKKGVRPESL